MKKIILTLVASLFTFITSNAQIISGQKVIGGELDFSNQNQRDTSLTGNTGADYNDNYYSASITAGKFVSSTHEKGLFINYALITNTHKPHPGSFNENIIEAGVYSKYYKSLGNGFYITLNWTIRGYYFFSRTISSDTISHAVEKMVGWGAGTSLSPGITYQLSKNWLVDLGLLNLVNFNYAHTLDKSSYTGFNDELVNNQWNVNTSLNNGILGNISISFRYLLNGKEKKK